MQLSKKFEELNKLERLVSFALYGIYSEFLNTNNSFPTQEKEELLKSYVNLRHKLYTERNSKISKLLSKVDEDRKKILEELTSPSSFEILSNVSKKLSIQIVNAPEKYIPTSEEELNEISSKLSEIYINLNYKDIKSIYIDVKKTLNRDNQNYDKKCAYLQKMYVEFMLKSIYSNTNSYSKRTLLNYEDVCKDIGEEVLVIKDNKKISNK